MKKFEYKRKLITTDWEVDEGLEELGKEGWELVVIEFRNAFRTDVPGMWNMAYFKREIPEPANPDNYSKEFYDSIKNYPDLPK